MTTLSFLGQRGEFNYKPFIKPAVFILLIVGFFLFYNSFIVDQSLEALQLSLSNVALAQTAGAASFASPFMQLQMANEASAQKMDTATLMGLSYSNAVLGSASRDRQMPDVTSVMRSVIAKKESKRNMILRFFDVITSVPKIVFRKLVDLVSGKKRAISIDPAVLNAINQMESRGELTNAMDLYRSTIAKYPDFAETPELMLRLGYLMQKLGRTNEASQLYGELIARFPQSPAARVCGQFISILKKKEAVRPEIDKLRTKIAEEKDVKIQQGLYYQMGLLELSVLELEGAKESFSKSAQAAPGTNIADQSRLRLGICENMLGELDKSTDTFNELASTTDNVEMKIGSQFQVAQIYRQKGDYEKTAAVLQDMATKFEYKKLQPMILYQLASTYLFDLKDMKKAKEAFEKLRTGFPADLLAYPGSRFADKFLELAVPAKAPKEFMDFFGTSWIEFLLPQFIKDAMRDAAVRFTTYITEGVTAICVTEQYDVEAGDWATIELTEKRLNGYIKRWFPAGAKENVWEVSLKYLGSRKLRVDGTVFMPPPSKAEIKGYIEGRFEMVKKPQQVLNGVPKPPENYILYHPYSCRIGIIPIPMAVLNVILKPSVEHFNKEFPLKIQEFKLDAKTILFAGPVRDDIKGKKVAEASDFSYLFEREAESGFIYGRRKETLGSSGVIKQQ